MADQNIHFKHAGDTGQREDLNAIQPYRDGEPAQQSVFRRPPENLRYRTEVLRIEGEDSKYLHDTDKGWRIVNANTLGENPSNPLPSVTWYPDGYSPGEGTFIVSAEIAVQPMNTPAVDSKETKSYSFPTPGPSAATVEFTAELFSYEGMNYRRIVWQDKPFSEIPNGYCLIEVTGGGTELNIVTITVRDDWTTSVADVQAQITAQAANLLLAGFTATTTGVGSTKIDALPTDYDYTMERTWERQLHHILPGDFATFFSSHGIADGDTLAIFYEWMVEDSGDGGRRQSTPTSGASPPNTAAGTRLFLTSEEPWKIPLSIPLCKRSGNDLFFIDGTVVTYPQEGTVHFGEHGYTLNAINDAIVTVGTPWADGSYLHGAGSPYEFTIEDALNYILEDLARTSTGNSGGQKIGLESFSSISPPSADPLTWSAGELRDYLFDVFTKLNRKGSLPEDETVTGEWSFNDLATFNSGVDLKGLIKHYNTSADQREAFGNTNYHLVYNSTDGDTYWNTLNIYEGQLAASVGVHMFVFGATYDSGTGVFTAAPDGSGSGKISVILQNTNGIYMMVSNTLIGPGVTTLSPLAPAGWPVWNQISGAGNVFNTDTTKKTRFTGNGDTVFEQDVEFDADVTFISTDDSEGYLWYADWFGVEDGLVVTGATNWNPSTGYVLTNDMIGFPFTGTGLSRDAAYFSTRLPADAVSGENIVVESFFRLVTTEAPNALIKVKLTYSVVSIYDTTPPSASGNRTVDHNITTQNAQDTIHKVTFVIPGTNINALDIIKCSVELYAPKDISTVDYLGSTLKYRTKRIADVWSLPWPSEG